MSQLCTFEVGGCMLAVAAATPAQAAIYSHDRFEFTFAETFEEHTANDRQRVQWCEDNPGKCTGAG